MLTPSITNITNNGPVNGVPNNGHQNLAPGQGNGAIGNGTEPQEEIIHFVLPTIASTHGSETRTLATEASISARGLFYNPTDSFKGELSSAAEKLLEFYQALPPEQQTAMGARILGAQGLMNNQTTTDLGNMIERVAEGNCTATDRISLVALMGDIGALLADTGATTGVGDRNADDAGQLREAIRGQFPSLSEENVERMKELGDSGVVGPNKSNERVRGSTDLVARQGLHGLGALADRVLGVNEADAIPVVEWQEASISETKVNNTAEPLSGHMSGSPSEVLMVWDALVDGDNTQPYTQAHDQTVQQGGQERAFHDVDIGEAKGARLAGATAMLVAIGFHSPVENIESALKYTGQNPRTDLIEGPQDDAASSLGQGAATALFTELYDYYRA
jgi:hypothetical protein